MKALQEETNVSLNVVDNLDKLISDINHGSLVSFIFIYFIYFNVKILAPNTLNSIYQ